MSRDTRWNAQSGWFKSVHSGGSETCVEVNLSATDEIGLRDSKDEGEGPVLVVSRPVYRAFLGAVRGGEFTA